MNRILVTGSNGLLGRYLVNLLKDKNLVYCLVNPENKSYLEGVNLIPIDLSKYWSSRFLPDKIDYIFHHAQSNKFRDFPNSSNDIFNVNIQSTAILLDYAKEVGVKKFIYTSTGGIYQQNSEILDENAKPMPFDKLGHYFGSKVCSEILVKSFSSIFQTFIIRPFFIYGPGQKRNMLMPRLFDFVLNGVPIEIQGEDGIKINPIHVNDASKVIANILKVESGLTLNMAGPSIYHIKEICDLIGEYLHIVPVFKKIPGEPNDLVADISVMEKILHKPQCQFQNFLCDLAI